MGRQAGRIGGGLFGVACLSAPPVRSRTGCAGRTLDAPMGPPRNVVLRGLAGAAGAVLLVCGHGCSPPAAGVASGFRMGEEVGDGKSLTVHSRERAARSKARKKVATETQRHRGARQGR